MLGVSFSRASTAMPTGPMPRVSFNLCQAVIDTLTSKIAKNEVTPTFITSGGIWGMQRKAENLSKFVSGCFYENQAHMKIVEAFNDAATWGDGFDHVYRTPDQRVGLERAVPHELFVDPIETLNGMARQLHRVKIVDRELLLWMFEDDKEAQAKIKDAMPANAQEVGGMNTAADLVKVTESWRLRSSKNAGDGLRVMCIEDELLLKDEYKRDYFPFPHLRYAKRKFGYWGIGACERLEKLQLGINREMILIDRSHYMGGSFKVLVENGSKVVSQHLNNDVGTIIHYSGTKPEYVTPPTVQPDKYTYVDSLIDKGFRQEGVSQLQASSLVPLGIKSGAALRDYDQISDDRQLYVAKAVEAFALEIASQMIEEVRDIAEEKKGYKVTWPGTSFLETIDWKDVNLERDEYILKAFPTSSLPEEPSARLETVQEYMQAGVISPRAGRRLLRQPDLEMSDNLANAAENLIMKAIEDILYDKKKSRPDDKWDLVLAKQIALEYWNYAILNNCPRDRIRMLENFMAIIDDELKLTAAASPGPAPTTAPPLANPQPTPQSNMVPNVNTGAA
jgi:hypothetical protein